MPGKLYFGSGGCLIDNEARLLEVVNTNRRGLIICASHRDAKTLSKLYCTEHVHFLDRYDTSLGALARDYAWIFVPDGFVSDEDVLRLRWRLRVGTFNLPESLT